MLEDMLLFWFFSATYPDRPGTWLTPWQDMRCRSTACCCKLMASSGRQVLMDLRRLLPPTGAELWGGLEAADHPHGHERHLRLLQRQGLPSSLTVSLSWPQEVSGLLSCSPPLQALFSVDNFIHYMTVSLEMLMNEVTKQPRARRVFLLGMNVPAVVTAASCPCFRSLVWSLMLSRSCPCRLWGRCRSPPQGACFRGEPVDV